MNFFEKIKYTIKNIIRINDSLQELKSEMKKIVDYVRFKFQENEDYKQLYEVSLSSGECLRRILGYENLNVKLHTEKPVAIDSLDHIHPWGTKQDNSKNLLFNKKLISLISLENIKLLDIGCSGGGFVKTIHDAGGFAVGIEGSDYSKIRKRAEWNTIPHRLFTADATAPFTLTANEEPLKFSIITAWEFIEHIEEEDLPELFNNFNRNLSENGIIIMSVSPIDDIVEGVNLHRTVKPFSWWVEKVQELGFVHHQDKIEHFAPNCWIRSEENATDSFHLILTRNGEDIPPNSV